MRAVSGREEKRCSPSLALWTEVVLTDLVYSFQQTKLLSSWAWNPPPFTIVPSSRILPHKAMELSLSILFSSITLQSVL